MSAQPLPFPPALSARSARYRGIATTTSVHCARGGIPAQDLRAGDILRSPYGSCTVTALRPVWQVPAIRIRHRFGEIRLPLDQEVTLLTGLHTWHSRPARLVMPGDRLAWDPTGYAGTPTTLPAMLFPDPAPSAHAWRITAPTLDPEIGWFLGYLAGNGTVYLPPPGAKSRTGSVSISCPGDAPELVARVGAAIRRFGIEPRVKPGDGNVVRVDAYATQFAEYLWTWVKRPNTPISVPPWIRDASRPVRSSFLAGVFDSDGSAKSRPLELCSSVYPTFLDELRQLYASLGIASEVGLARKAHGNWHPLFRLTTRGIEQREAVAQAIGPWSTKHRQVRPLRSVGGFDFPTAWVRGEIGSSASQWLAPGPTQTTARITRLGGITFPAYPLAVEEVCLLAEGMLAVEIIVSGGETLTAEGIVLTARTEASSGVRRAVA